MGIAAALTFAGLPIGFGLVLIWLGRRARREALERGAWATAPGTITASSVRSREIALPVIGRRTLRSSGFTFGEGPRVTYGFEVGGRTYEGTRIGDPPGRRPGRRRRRGEIWDLAAFETGRPVQVHYDPRDPARNMLHPPAAGGWAALIGMGVAFVVLGLMAASVLRGL